MSERSGAQGNAGHGDRGLSRRQVLQGAGAGLVVVGSSGILAACGSGSSTSASGSSPGPMGKPVRGGVLRVGAQGGSNTDTLDAHNILTNADYARGPQLYNALARLDNKGQFQLELADSFEPNKTADEWTVRIKKGVLTHAGKPFGAKDVLFSANRIVKGNYAGKPLFGPIDLNASKALDELTVRFVFKGPYSVFDEAMALQQLLWMVPVGYNPEKPIGTGPFKLKSFTPGRESATVRFDQYWGRPEALSRRSPDDQHRR